MINKRETRVNTEQKLQNNHFVSEFLGSGKLVKIKDIDSEIEEMIVDKFVCYNGEEGKTESGHYTFNPEEKFELSFNNIAMYRFDLPGIASIIQVHLYNKNTDVLKTHIVYQDGQVDLQRQLLTQIQIYTSRALEISYKLIKHHKDSNSNFMAYADDSMKLVKRPIYTKEFKYGHKNDIDIYGYFTSSCVHGGMIREKYISESFLGWSNSNPIGCTFSKQNEVELMIFRTAKVRNNKGINDEFLEEFHVLTTDFVFYIDDTIDGITHKKLAGNAKLNEPLSIFMTDSSPSFYNQMYHSDSVLNHTFDKRDSLNQLSKTYGEIDVVDFKIRKHNIINDYSDIHEIDIVLRNRFNNYVTIAKSDNGNGEGLFKNEYIDTIKNMRDATYKFKMDPNHKILKDDRYDLEVFENEVSNVMVTDYNH